GRRHIADIGAANAAKLRIIGIRGTALRTKHNFAPSQSYVHTRSRFPRRCRTRGISLTHAEIDRRQLFAGLSSDHLRTGPRVSSSHELIVLIRNSVEGTCPPSKTTMRFGSRRSLYNGSPCVFRGVSSSYFPCDISFGTRICG